MIFRAGNGTEGDEDFASTLAGLEWESQERDETWLISYADIVSTLLAMVVLLFGRMAMTSASPAEEAVSTGALDTEAVIDVVTPQAEDPLAESIEVPRLDSRRMAPLEGPRPEDRLADLVEARFDGRIRAERRDRGLVLTIPEVALFDSARAQLQDSANPLLTELVATLHEVGEAQISVDGHTDDRPVLGGEFDSNWDLAAARANAVTRYLLDRGFDPKRLHSVSYADTRPVADNATAAGRAANRRVELEIEFVQASGPEAPPL